MGKQPCWMMKCRLHWEKTSCYTQTQTTQTVVVSSLTGTHSHALSIDPTVKDGFLTNIISWRPANIWPQETISRCIVTLTTTSLSHYHHSITNSFIQAPTKIKSKSTGMENNILHGCTENRLQEKSKKPGKCSRLRVHEQQSARNVWRAAKLDTVSSVWTDRKLKTQLFSPSVKRLSYLW